MTLLAISAYLTIGLGMAVGEAMETQDSGVRWQGPVGFVLTWLLWPFALAVAVGYRLSKAVRP